MPKDVSIPPKLLSRTAAKFVDADPINTIFPSLCIKHFDKESFAPPKSYVNIPKVSFTVVETDLPPAVTVSVSAPSVSPSLINETEIVARPLELTTALPLNKPPDMSALLMPESV